MQVEGYTLGRVLGRGATATVYEGTRGGERVAVKVSSRTRSLDARARKRVQAELDASSRLVHPGVVRPRSAGEVAGQLYVIMDLVEGESLQSRLDRAGPLTVDEARALVRSLAVALSYVHGCGVLHRDLKPDNVLLGNDQRPRITDFGIARDLDDDSARLTQSGALLGTPGYLAPEQIGASRDRVGAAADVYGLGGVLYACLTGSPPVTGEGLPELLSATAAGRIAPPRSLRPEVDRELERLCLDCLALDPARRPRVEDVARALGGGGRPPGPSRRRRLLLAAAALAALAALGWAALRPREPSPERLAELRASWDTAPAATQERALEALVEDFPDSAQAHLLMAEFALTVTSSHDRAREAIDAALAREPRSTPALALGLRIYRAQGDADGLRALLDRAVEVDPRRFLRERAYEAQAREAFAEADRDLLAWLELEPDDVLPWLALARSAHGQRRYLKAVDYFDESLRRLAEDVHGQLHYERAQTQLRAKRYSEAVADFERTAELRGGWDVSLTAGCAEALTGAGRYPEAAARYREALAGYPNQPQWTFTLYQLELALERPAEAAALLERAYELSLTRSMHPRLKAEIRAAWEASRSR